MSANDVHGCPEHGKVLRYAPDQGDEYEQREHLECSVPGCTFHAWVLGECIWRMCPPWDVTAGRARLAEAAAEYFSAGRQP